MLMVGKEAPNFTANAYYNGDFKQVELNGYKGKWVVLLFYPGDFTFVWTTEVTAVADRYEEFKALNTEVLALSVDSQFVHKAWFDNELSKMVKEIPYPMLSDPRGDIGSMYGVYDETAMVEFRGRVIIDPDGIIQSVETVTPPVGRNVDEVFRQLKALQVVRESKGTQATPCGWTEEKKTLFPSPKMVGKVFEEWKVDDAK